MNVPHYSGQTKATRIIRILRTSRSQSGQSLLELALLAPILLAVVLGTAELGRYAYLSILVGNAAEAGAQYGAQSLEDSADTTGIQTAAQNDFKNGQNLSGLVVTTIPICGCDSGGATSTKLCTGGAAGACAPGEHWVVMVQVTATGTFSSLLHYPAIPSSLSIQRTATTRVKDE